jgi:hypothetical protein
LAFTCIAMNPAGVAWRESGPSESPSANVRDIESGQVKATFIECLRLTHRCA